MWRCCSVGLTVQHAAVQEIDYELEGRNADRFRGNFAKVPWVKVPRVYWGQTSMKASMDGASMSDSISRAS